MKEKKPIYMEIYEDMKEKIDRGDMKIGMKLESKRTLSNRMNIGIGSLEKLPNKKSPFLLDYCRIGRLERFNNRHPRFAAYRTIYFQQRRPLIKR